MVSHPENDDDVSVSPNLKRRAYVLRFELLGMSLDLGPTSSAGCENSLLKHKIRKYLLHENIIYMKICYGTF